MSARLTAKTLLTPADKRRIVEAYALDTGSEVHLTVSPVKSPAVTTRDGESHCCEYDATLSVGDREYTRAFVHDRRDDIMLALMAMAFDDLKTELDKSRKLRHERESNRATHQ